MMIKSFLLLQTIFLVFAGSVSAAEVPQEKGGRGGIGSLTDSIKGTRNSLKKSRELQMGMMMMMKNGRRGGYGYKYPYDSSSGGSYYSSNGGSYDEYDVDPEYGVDPGYGWGGGYRGKGKGMSKSKSKSKGYYYDSSDYSNSDGGGGYGWSDIYPTAADINFLDDNFFDDKFFDDDDCELIHLNETFSVPRAARFLAPDTSPTNMGTPTIIGTVFIWENQQVLEVDGHTPIVGTTVSGSCVRTSTSVDGMGTCLLVFKDDDEYTINVAGLLTGPLGSQMGITGGTGGLVGVIGEMDFLPLYETPGVGDVFLNATRYEVHADLGLIVCPAQ